MDVNGTWISRGTKPDTFYMNSTRYGSNLDLQPSKVPFLWTINDTTSVFRQDANPNRVDNATKQRWKEFNTFEEQNFKRLQKD
jgi:hypothetical protein